MKANPKAPGTSVGDEALLLQRLRKGDEQDFAELVDRYHGPLLRLALVFVSNRAIADEVVQETWLGVIAGLERFEGHSTLKTWIFRILTNRAKTRGVREKRSVPFSDLGAEDNGDEVAVDAARFKPNGMWGIPPRRWEDDTPDTLAMNRQAISELQKAITTLPANQRAVLTLRDIDGLDSAEVCNVLEISETNQRVLLHRARSKVRAVLEAYLEQV